MATIDIHLELTSRSLRPAPELMQPEALLGPARPRPTKKWVTRHVKMMLVGDSGLGKTTLLRTLLSGKVSGSTVFEWPGYHCSVVKLSYRPR